jgi:hypothetical protein
MDNQQSLLRVESLSKAGYLSVKATHPGAVMRLRGMPPYGKFGSTETIYEDSLDAYLRS